MGVPRTTTAVRHGVFHLFYLGAHTTSTGEQICICLLLSLLDMLTGLLLIHKLSQIKICVNLQEFSYLMKNYVMNSYVKNLDISAQNSNTLTTGSSMPFITITDEKTWLEKRKNYVTSTEVAALYGLSPWMTAFELYHIKRGNIQQANVSNNFMKFGKILEEPICKMILLEHPEWEINGFPFFYYDDTDKIGSSFDRIVIIDGKTWLLEIKSISYAEYKKKFTDDEAPPVYEIQMQTELEVSDKFDGIVLAVFILDTREIRYIFRERDREMGAEMRQAVREFWGMNEPPEPDWERDKSVIAKMCPDVDESKSLDATENNEITELAAQINASNDLIKQEEKNIEGWKGKLLTLLGNSHYAWTRYHKITRSTVKPNLGKEVTQAMVGTRIGAKAGHTRLTITEIGTKNDE